MRLYYFLLIFRFLKLINLANNSNLHFILILYCTFKDIKFIFNILKTFSIQTKEYIIMLIPS